MSKWIVLGLAALGLAAASDAATTHTAFTGHPGRTTAAATSAR